MNDVYSIHISTHLPTGYAIAVCDDVPGFMFYARSKSAMLEEMEQGFREYMGYIGKPLKVISIKFFDEGSSELSSQYNVISKPMALQKETSVRHS